MKAENLKTVADQPKMREQNCDFLVPFYQNEQLCFHGEVFPHHLMPFRRWVVSARSGVEVQQR